MDSRLLYTSMATATAMALAFVYLYWRTRERSFLLWTWASVLWTTRYALGAWRIWADVELWAWVLPVLAVVRGFLMYWGAQAHRGKQLPPAAVATGVATLAWSAALVRTADNAALLLPPFGLLAAGFAWAGWVLARDSRLPRVERYVTGGAMALFGAMQLAYPAAMSWPWIIPWGFSLSAALQTVMAVGMLVTYFRWSVEAAASVARREEVALARVLSDFVRICAHCQEVRDEEDNWVPVESYVGQRTAAEVNEVLCPECAGG